MRVLIAENHPDLSEVMSRIIDAEPDMRCVGRIASANEVLSKARDSSADALVLDLSLHGGSGLQLIEELAAELPGAARSSSSAAWRTARRPRGNASAGGPPSSSPRAATSMC